MKRGKGCYSGQPKDFDWLNGTNVGDTYSNFAGGEPNNDQTTEDCGVFYTSTKLWSSELCGSQPYVCQKKAGYLISLRIFNFIFKAWIDFCKYKL